MTTDASAIVRASFEAYVNKDRSALDQLLAPDFHFTSPLDNRLDRATYFDVCWPNSTKLAKFEILSMACVEDRVFVSYIGYGADGHRFRNTEVHTLRGGMIVEVEVYFGWSLPHPASAGAHLNA